MLLFIRCYVFGFLLLGGFNFNFTTPETRDSIEKAEKAEEDKEENELQITFSKLWKYRIGDDSLFAATKYNDQGWDTIHAEDEIDFKDYPALDTVYNIVWFRTWIHVDSAAVSKALGIYVQQNGSAASIYLDGTLIENFGQVGHDKKSEQARFNINTKPFPLVFAKTGKHLLAIRFSSHHSSDLKGKRKNTKHGFGIAFTDLQDKNNLDELLDKTVYFPVIFLLAVFLTLGITHIIMFFYFRSNMLNIFFGLYCSGIAFILYFLYYTISETDYEVYSFLTRSVIYLAPLVVIPLVALYHTIYYQKLLRIFWIIMLVYAGGALSTYMEWRISRFLVAVIIILATYEIIRMNIRSVIKKRDGAFILGMGILYIPISVVLLVMVGLYFDDHEDSLLAEIILKILAYFMALSIPFSITLYLARNFARLNKKLIRQVDEIQELSDKNLQQEKEKQEILEEQNLVLETKVDQRTRELAGKNREIMLKNREITDNLTYARRIQAALLPETAEMKAAFRECFILYLPKDIVSGDFYSFFRKDNRLLVAVADCTGHGVSGAFMSMIGSSLLSQIINTRDLNKPSEILEALNEEIITSLNQRSGDSNDGMDIALISFNPAERVVEFAGANRPMWLIRNNELIIYRPDKFPIGGLQVVKEQHFKNNSIVVTPGDCIYLFSDGFADQFGGAQGKKLMTKRLKNLLLENHMMPMDEQEQFFFSFIQEWKGSNEQLDDILVMGIRI